MEQVDILRVERHTPNYFNAISGEVFYQKVFELHSFPRGSCEPDPGTQFRSVRADEPHIRNDRPMVVSAGGLIAHDEVEVCSWLLLENCSESVRRRVNSGPTQADAQPEYDLRDDVDPGWEEDDVTFACISPIDRLLDRDRVIT